MALNTTALFQQSARNFSSSVASPDFAADFQFAVNLALDDLSFAAAMTTPMTHIASAQADIADLDDDDLSILAAGVAAKLVESGRTFRGQDLGYYSSVLLPAWERAQGRFLTKKSRDDQAASGQDADGVPESDIFGLGYVGDE